MSNERAVVAVIDDDESVRETLQRLLETVALKVEAFGSADAFLKASQCHTPNCIVLDIRMPGTSGLDLQDELASANNHTPIVFITGYGDIPMSVRAMKAGAVEFLVKPFREQELLDAVRRGIKQDSTRRAEDQAMAELRMRLASLTPCEGEVMALLTAGWSNKQIAGQMGISATTARVHRNQVLHKMCARSVADLVRMADKLDGQSPKQPPT
jgi:FixJ family two-component response regulator